MSALFGIVIAGLSAAFFGVPGFLLGAIVGAVVGLSLNEWLHRNKPENRRRARRMMRNEGLR